MAKKKPETTPDTTQLKPPPGDGFREIVESVAVAFVLALLFRTFEAEAFVIPTGSMAPTLMGRHKDLTCQKCGYPYRVSASDEVDKEGWPKPGYWLTACTCPMCNYTMDIEPVDLQFVRIDWNRDRRLSREEFIGHPSDEQLRQFLEGKFKYFDTDASSDITLAEFLSGEEKPEYPSYKGDRILVAKFPYEIQEPQRWDVVVFKFPEEAQTNFIKRLIGLPNETIRLQYGDVFTKVGDSPFVIARKSPRKLQSMLQIVYDNDYALPAMIDAGWPARWQPCPAPMEQLLARGWPESADAWPYIEESPGGHWKSSADHKSFACDGSSPDEVWLRYQHLVPTPPQWVEIERGKLATAPRISRITDFNAYNHYEIQGNSNSTGDGDNWTGDLAITCELQASSNTGLVILELIEGGVRFQCRFDLASGEAVISNSAQSAFQAKAVTPVIGPGTYQVAFANVDDELRLWVDGGLVSFDVSTSYDGDQYGTRKFRDADYSPVGIASQGATVSVNHLTISRDLYYIAYEGMFAPSDNPQGAEFHLQEDQFFVLGDNSARSMDARAWTQGERYVHRNLLIGKALFIYWPHSFDKFPGSDVYFPMYPNFERMGFVR